MPKKVPRLGEEKGIVPMVSPGKARPLEGAGNSGENGSSLRTALVTWGCSPRPGLRRAWGGPKVHLGSAVVPFQKVKSVFAVISDLLV